MNIIVWVESKASFTSFCIAVLSRNNHCLCLSHRSDGAVGNSEGQCSKGLRNSQLWLASQSPNTFSYQRNKPWNSCVTGWSKVWGKHLWLASMRSLQSFGEKPWWAIFIYVRLYLLEILAICDVLTPADVSENRWDHVQEAYCFQLTQWWCHML